MSPQPPKIPGTHIINPLTLEWEPRRLHPIEEKAIGSYDSLTDVERAWYTITRLIFCIRDGGLISYYYNGYAEHVRDLVPALEAVGATDAKALVLRMNSLFGPEVPRTIDDINAAIKQWPNTRKVRRITSDNDAEQSAASDAEERLREYVAAHGLRCDA